MKPSTAMPFSFAVVILAAGKGTRFKGDRPKVLQELHGLPLVAHVVAAARAVGPERIVVVVGHHRGQVEAVLRGSNAVFATQEEALGTGHAVLAAHGSVPSSVAAIVVLNGDVPLIRAQTVAALVAKHRETSAAATVLSAQLDDPSGYGRIVRGADGRVTAIVEEKDASAAERAIHEVNAGAYVFAAPLIFEVLARVGQSNAQREYYLTDAVALLVAAGARVEAVVAETPGEILGVNRPEDLEALRGVQAAPDTAARRSRPARRG